MLSDAADVGPPRVFGGFWIAAENGLADGLKIVRQTPVHPRQVILSPKHMHLHGGHDPLKFVIATDA